MKTPLVRGPPPESSSRRGGILLNDLDACLGVNTSFGQTKLRALERLPIQVRRILRITPQACGHTPATSSMCYQAPRSVGYL